MPTGPLLTTDLVIADITSTLQNLNPEDSVLALTGALTGHAKIKARHDHAASSLGREIIRLTASACSADGRALVINGAPAILSIEGQLVVQSQSETDLVAELTNLRQGLAIQALRALVNQNAITAVAGVGV
jgi:hypothetical protein